MLLLSATYPLHANGPGAQVLAGPYVALLPGSRYDYTAVHYNSSAPIPDAYAGEVQTGDT